MFRWSKEMRNFRDGDDRTDARSDRDTSASDANEALIHVRTVNDKRVLRPLHR